MRRRREKILIVGAGLTGAGLAYVAVRRGLSVVVVSSDRPASQATALTPGAVRGAGPPGLADDWVELGESSLTRMAERERRGFVLLQEVVLRSSKSMGYARTVHERVCLDPSARVLELVPLLRKAGFEFDDFERDGRAVLCRTNERLIQPRRLTLELLRQARLAGANLRLNTQITQIGVLPTGPPFVSFADGRRESYDRVLWAGGWPESRALESALPIDRSQFQRRVALQQRISTGRKIVPRLFEWGNAQMMLSPDPVDPHAALVMRVAIEEEGGIRWPQAPPAWTPYLGLASQQKLAESIVGPIDRRFDPSAKLVFVSGFCGWPISGILGACEDAVGRRTRSVRGPSTSE